MKRYLYFLAMIGLVAGIVHILIILLIPSFAAKDAWAKLENAGEPWSFSILKSESGGDSILPLVDPSFSIAACRYDLTETPLRVTAEGSLPFWSVAIFDRFGRNIYSFNDRTAVEGQLSLVVVDPVQLARIRKDLPEDISDAVLVESGAKQGFILIRAFQPDASWKSTVQKFLESARCAKYSAPVEPNSG